MTSSANDAALVVDSLWKIFGNGADKIIGTPDADLSRKDLQTKTGCVMAVKDVSFEVAPGEVFVVMGLSGSGKSTLIRLLTRLIEPTSGRVVMNGEEITGANDVQLRELRRHHVSMVSFTGGLATGQAIIRASAATVKRVAVELGGKNPNIVFADAVDGVGFETVVDNALTAVFLHSGQVCSAGARLIVEESVADAVVAEIAARADAIRIGNGLDPASQTGPLVSEAHRAKIEDFVASARAEGARVTAGGCRPDDPDLARGYFYRPTVLDGCHRGMRAGYPGRRGNNREV